MKLGLLRGALAPLLVVALLGVVTLANNCMSSICGGQCSCTITGQSFTAGFNPTTYCSKNSGGYYETANIQATGTAKGYTAVSSPVGLNTTIGQAYFVTQSPNWNTIFPVGGGTIALWDQTWGCGQSNAFDCQLSSTPSWDTFTEESCAVATGITIRMNYVVYYGNYPDNKDTNQTFQSTSYTVASQ